MTWAAQVEIPLQELGRVQLPKYRIRYTDGFVRMGLNAAKTRLVATLEDKDGKSLTFRTQTEACAKATMMGHAICWHLMKHNKYEPGEPVGDREKVIISNRVITKRPYQSQWLWDNAMTPVKDFDTQLIKQARVAAA